MPRTGAGSGRETALPPPPLTLIVTRPAAQAARWAADFAEALRTQARAGPPSAALRGEAVDDPTAQTRELPLIAIEAIEDTAPLHAAWRHIDLYALVMFVSANAVEHFFAAAPPGGGARAGGAGRGAVWPAGVLAGATGPGTVAALYGAGVPAPSCVAPEAAGTQDSEALWRRLESRPWDGRRVLVVRGQDGRDWLADRLRARGAAVEFVAAYRRRAPRFDAGQRLLLQAARTDPARHLWLFSSSEAVANLRAAQPAADWTASRALASHPRIAQAATQAGFGRVDTGDGSPGAVAAWLLRADGAAWATPAVPGGAGGDKGPGHGQGEGEGEGEEQDQDQDQGQGQGQGQGQDQGQDQGQGEGKARVKVEGVCGATFSSPPGRRSAEEDRPDTSGAGPPSIQSKTL